VGWACRTIPGLADVQAFDRAAALAPEDCHGVRFIADGPAGSGRWTGLEHPEATPDDQARAVLVTLVERMAALFSKLDADGPVLACGGGAESKPWRGILSRRLGVPIEKRSDVSPSLGAARMAHDWLRNTGR
jgi:sugar (pentulose or hexulose) kinase